MSTESGTDGGDRWMPTARPVRRLTRRTDGKMVAGVAGGLADYLGIDAVLVRIVWLVFIFTGVGFIAYLAAWWLIPAADQTDSPGERTLERLADGPTWIAVVLLIAGAAILVGNSGIWAPSFIWGLALIGLGVFLYRRDREGRDPRAPSGPGAPWVAGAPGASGTAGDPSIAGPSSALPPAEASGLRETPAAVTAPVQSAAVPRVRRERSTTGWFAIGAAFALLGVVALLDQAGAFNPTPAQYLALPLTVLGAGLLLGAWMGRARWLILPCLLLVPLVAAASLIHVPIRGGFGDAAYAPTSVAAIRSEYRLVAGRMTLDLSGIYFTGQAVTVRASVMAGELVVLVPAGVPVGVSGTVSAGTFDVFGGQHNGLRVSVGRGSAAPAVPSGLTLLLDASFGQVLVTRVTSTGIPSGFTASANSLQGVAPRASHDGSKPTSAES
jgi:phage shock protein PspC (stress-responsive transcriptional regulator)